MASAAVAALSLQSQFMKNPMKQSQSQKAAATARKLSVGEKKRSFSVKAAVGELSSDSTTYLIAGAAAVALLGTAFPIIFSRKDKYALSILFPPSLYYNITCYFFFTYSISSDNVNPTWV
ncbi:Macrolide export ATP-binding/permease protein MacB [Bienertia sinuspersici]